MGSCQSDKRRIDDKLSKGIHHHKAVPAHPKKISKNGQQNSTTLPSVEA